MRPQSAHAAQAALYLRLQRLQSLRIDDSIDLDVLERFQQLFRAVDSFGPLAQRG
jgi:hypothetical protein